jgi:hypothetical protein
MLMGIENGEICVQSPTIGLPIGSSFSFCSSIRIVISRFASG